jgi:multimeric flavodoxin WrbA
MKAFIDRVSLVVKANGQAMLKHKVSGAVIAVRRGGAIHDLIQ